MSKNILIDASNANETRVAVTDDGKLDDFEIESNKKNAVKGDVYLAKITRVEPSLQAAFVDFGANRNGFLPLTEIHPDYFKIPSADEAKLKELLEKQTDNEQLEETDESTENNQVDRNDDLETSDEGNKKIRIKALNPKKEYYNFFRKYKIQDVIKPRQVILVQINKEERGLKGAALTTFLSFAGRYCVLMPNSMNNDGISRKIGDLEERKKLKQILSSVSIPERMSVIVRTAGIGKTKKEISKDLTFLLSQWNKIRETTLNSEAPKLIYEEGNVLKRTIRDLLTPEVANIFVDGKEGYDKIKKLSKNLTPSQTKKIKQFKSKDKSLFVEHNIETQINELFSLNVKLDSGGSIVINTTEALVAIDVNSGKNTSERNIESTALKTNVEAAVEIARQLRLRDLGGLVVIDFIDMEDYRNNFKVEKTLKTELVRDRARVQVGRISMFGLMELSRQRLKTSLMDRSFDKCIFCKGSGLMLNSSSICDQIVKIITEKVSQESNKKIKVKCNTSLAAIILNDKKNEIINIENKYKSKIEFDFNNQYSLHDPIIEVDENIHTQRENTKSVLKKVEKKLNSKISKNTNKTKVKVKKKEIKKVKTKIKTIKKEDDRIEQDLIINDEGKNDKTGWWS